MLLYLVFLWIAEVSAVGQDPRRQRELGSPQALWGGVGGEAAERGDAPAAPPKASPFPGFPGQGAAQGPRKASHT